MVEEDIRRVKKYLMRYPRLYKLLIVWISPVYSSQGKLRERIQTYFGGGDKVVNVGSGCFNLHPNFINLDFEKYENVHVVANAKELPFKDDSLEGVVNIALLEHVDEPDEVIDEIYRVLKPGGHILTYVPFLQGYHRSPDDYHRWTKIGVKVLHQRFSEIDTWVSGGPTSSLLGVFIEWIAITFSLGNGLLYSILYIICMGLLWPVKFLDILIGKTPKADRIASSFYYIGQKI